MLVVAFKANLSLIWLLQAACWHLYWSSSRSIDTSTGIGGGPFRRQHRASEMREATVVVLLAVVTAASPPPPPLYVAIEGGDCTTRAAGHITSASECTTASNEFFSGSGTAWSHFMGAGYPPYCSLQIGGNYLHFNTNINSTQGCDSGQPCLCVGPATFLPSPPPSPPSPPPSPTSPPTVPAQADAVLAVVTALGGCGNGCTGHPCTGDPCSWQNSLGQGVLCTNGVVVNMYACTLLPQNLCP